jgi:hypothetical protein
VVAALSPCLEPIDGKDAEVSDELQEMHDDQPETEGAEDMTEEIGPMPGAETPPPETESDAGEEAGADEETAEESAEL